MPIGIIVAIVTAILIVVIVSGAGYYYYTKAPEDGVGLSNVDASGAQVSLGILSSVDGPVTTIDRTSNISGSNSAALAAAANSGSITATQIAPVQGGPSLPHQSGVVTTAPTAPMSVSMTAPLVTQSASPAATITVAPSPYARKISELVELERVMLDARKRFGVTTDPELTNNVKLADKSISEARGIILSLANAQLLDKEKEIVKRVQNTAETVGKELIEAVRKATDMRVESDIDSIRILMRGAQLSVDILKSNADLKTKEEAYNGVMSTIKIIEKKIDILNNMEIMSKSTKDRLSNVSNQLKEISKNAITLIDEARSKQADTPKTISTGTSTPTVPVATITQNIFGSAPNPPAPVTTVTPIRNIFGVAVAPRPTGTVAAPPAPVWDPNIPRLSVLFKDIDEIHNVVVRSNADFNTKSQKAARLPSVERLKRSLMQEIKNADPKTDTAKYYSHNFDVYKSKIDVVVAVIKAGPPPPRQPAPTAAPVQAAAPVVAKPPATMPTVAPVVSAGSSQYNVLKTQIDIALKTALDPKTTDAQKIIEAKKLPSLAVFKQAADRALAEAQAAPGVATANLVSSVQRETKDYTLKLTQALTILDALKISPCGNSKESAALLGCRTYPYSVSVLGNCAKDRTGVSCAPGTGCVGKICVQGPPTGVLKYTNTGSLLSFFK